MADQRNITFGMQFQKLDEALNQLENLQESIGEIKNDMIMLEQEGDEVGTRVRAGAEVAAEGIGKIGTEVQNAGSNIADGLSSTKEQFSNIGTEAKNAGDQISSSFLRADEQLNETAENAQEAGESLSNSFTRARTRLREIGKEAQDVGNEVGSSFESVGDRIRRVSSESAAAGERLSGSFNSVGVQFRKIGAESSSMGKAIAGSAGTALKEYNSLPKAIRAGMDGAFGYAEKRIQNFQKSATGGIKKLSQAFKDPIGTIKNELADALQKAGTEIKDVEDDAEDAEKDLKDMGDSGEDAGTSIKDALGSIAGKFAALQAGVEILKAGMEAAKEFASSVLEISKNTENVGAKFDAVFADDAGAAQWTENFASEINRSKTEVQNFMVQNKAMYNEMGITGQAANDLSKVTTSLAYDLGTAFKMDDAEALSTIQDYISGNTSALAQYGVQINDTVLQQTALSMGIKKNVDELSEAEAAQVRMNALLENTTSIQQKAAGAQTGYANGIKSIKAKATELMEGIGTKFTPAFDKIVGAVLDAWPKIEPPLMQFFDFLSKGIETAGPALINFATTALPPLITTLQEVFTAAQPIGSVLAQLATTALPPLVSALAPVVSVIGNLAQAILPPFANIISMIATSAIPPLVDIANTLIGTVIEPVMPILENLVSALMPGIQSMLQAVTPLLNALSPVLQVIGTVLGEIVGFLAKIVGFAAEGVGTLISKVAGLFGGGGSGNGGGNDDLPHNDTGTPDFPGGWTHINERGGEVAFLPGGSTIIPADKSRQLISNVASQETVSGELNINVTVSGSGDMDRSTLQELEDRFRRIVREEAPKIFQKESRKQAEKNAIQDGYA